MNRGCVQVEEAPTTELSEIQIWGENKRLQTQVSVGTATTMALILLEGGGADGRMASKHVELVPGSLVVVVGVGGGRGV